MKKISDIKNNKTLSLDPFKGIDTRGRSKDGAGCKELVNFRIKEDGSLERREGFSYVYSLNYEARAVWSGQIDGKDKCFILAGNEVVVLEPDYVSSTVAYTDNYEGDAEFFFYRGRLYLVDGNKIRYLSGNTLTSPSGYAPLVAKGWSGHTIGKINEPRNILSRRARYEYVMGDEIAPILYFDTTLSSVDAIYVNGSLIASDRYDLMPNKWVVSVSGLSPHDTVLVCVTYEEDHPYLEMLSEATHATVFGGVNNSIPYVWGSPDNLSMMFSSRYVSDDDLAEARRVCDDCDELYFPVGYEFVVGDGQYPVRAVSRHYDRLLIFTEGGAWMANDPNCGSKEFPIININTSIGTVSHGAVEIENQVFTVGKQGIYCWDSNTDELNDCNAHLISAPIQSQLSEKFLKNSIIYANQKQREVLVASTSSSDVWCYSLASKQWSKFTGLYAQYFFDYFGELGYAKEYSVYCLYSWQHEDGGSEITTRMTTDLMDFGSAEKKQIEGIEVALEGGNWTVELYADNEKSPSVTAKFNGSGYRRESRRIHMRRFKALKVKIIADGYEKCTMYSLKIKIR